MPVERPLEETLKETLEETASELHVVLGNVPDDSDDETGAVDREEDAGNDSELVDDSVMVRVLDDWTVTYVVDVLGAAELLRMLLAPDGVL